MTWVLSAGAAMTVLACAGVVGLLRMQRREQAFKQRVSGLTGKRAGRRPVEPIVLVRRSPRPRAGSVQHLAAIIGLDLARRDQYRLPWIVVLGGAVLAARAAVLMASGIVGAWAWVLLPIVTIGGARAYYAAANRKRRDKLLTQFPDALALVVRAVRVGIPVPEALRAVAREMPEPTRSEFDRLQQQVSMGAALEIALRALAARNDLPEYGFFAAVLALQAQTGGALTETLESLADIIRRRIAMKERGHALSSEARASSYVLGALPLVTAGLLYFASPSYIGLLLSEPLGHILLGAAALSLATGMGTMRLIIRRTLS